MTILTQKSTVTTFKLSAAIMTLIAGAYLFTLADNALAATENVIWTNLSAATANGNTLTATSSAVGGYGVSSQSIASGDGYLEFTAGTPDGNRAAGLSVGSSNQELEAMRYTIRLNGAASAEVWENGSYMTETTYVTNNVFRIEIASGIVKYKKNGTIFYTSSVAPTYPLLVHAAIYNQNTSINNAIISYGSVTPPPPPPPAPTPTPTPTPVPPPPPPPSGSPAWTNEPSGFTPIEESGWENGAFGNWYQIHQSSDRPVSIANVTDSLISETKMLQLHYNQGHTGGGGTEVRYDIPSAQMSNELYVGYYMKVNALYQGHNSGINKMVYLHDGGVNFGAMWYEMFGSGSGVLDLYVVNQSGSGPSGFHENVNEVTFPRNQWHKVEIYQKQGSSNNGIVKVWVNGVLAINRSDVDTSSNNVDNVTISGIWGGVGDTKNQPDDMWFDRIRISKPGAVSPPPPPPPPPSGTWPNEPAGFSRIAEYDATGIVIDGPTSSPTACTSSGVLDGCWWKFASGAGGNLSAVTEPTAPKSPSGVFQFRYPIGLAPGSEVGILQGWDTPEEIINTEYREIYESGWARTVGPDFQNQAVGTKLLGYWGVGQNGGPGVPNQIYNGADGNGSTTPMSSMQLSFFQQNQVSRRLSPNTGANSTWVSGVWNRYELHFKLNDIGVANGIMKVWWNGNLIINYSDVEYRTTAAPSGFYSRRLDPVWGGVGGGSRTRNDYLQYDHIYISGVSMNGSPVVGDINTDHIVNSIDYSILNSQWFTSNSQSDLNTDGLVNAIDYSLLNANWFRTW